MEFVARMRSCMTSISAYTGVLDPPLEAAMWTDAFPQAKSHILRTGIYDVVATGTDTSWGEYSYLSPTTPIAFGDNAVSHVKTSTMVIPLGYRAALGYEWSVLQTNSSHRTYVFRQTVRGMIIPPLVQRADGPIYADLTIQLSPDEPYYNDGYLGSGRVYCINWERGYYHYATIRLKSKLTTRDEIRDNPCEVMSLLRSPSSWEVFSSGNWNSDPYTVQVSESTFSPPERTPVDWAEAWFQRAMSTLDAEVSAQSDKYYALGSIATRMADQLGRLLCNTTSLGIETANLFRSLVGVLRGKPTELQSLVKRALTASSAKDRAKILADLRLSSQYGAKLTIQDFADVASFLQPKSGDLVTARSSGMWGGRAAWGAVRTEEHWKCWVSKSRAYAPAIAQLFRNDFVGFNNIWDLLPYSFVVDWAVPVGDILQAWDDELMLQNMAIDAIVVGRKTTGQYSVVSGDREFVISISRYTRSRRPSFPPYATKHLNVSADWNILLNGSALIVQRL